MSKSNILFNLHQSFSIAFFFMEHLIDSSFINLDDKELDEAQCTLGCLSTDPATPADWQFAISSANIDNKNLIKSEDVFKALYQLFYRFHKEFGFEIPNLVAFLEHMSSHSLLHKSEWLLWDKAIQRVLNGEEAEFG